MNESLRWEKCILQRGVDAESFFRQVFKEDNRQILLVAGAGFDPRTHSFSRLLSEIAPAKLDALYLREERPNPDQELVKRSESNLAIVKRLIPSANISPITIFTSDNAVVAGRNAVSAMRKIDVSSYSDICVDCSALSRGISFPLIRYILDFTKARRTNVHVLVADEPMTDDSIVAVPWERADYMLGFRGESLAAKDPAPARLWLPHLVPQHKTAFDLIHKIVDPNDTCPILPFPAKNPKGPDLLIQEYSAQLQNVWQVDPRNLVYADESNPLDLYRSILKLDSARAKVFRQNRTSQLILSPLGSKLLSIGSLMAAIERNFPVVYVEAVEYRVSFADLDQSRQEPGPLVHLWLQGEAYEVD